MKSYDVQIDYVDLKGDAVCELRWSSPSTPLEVIDYLGSSSIHATSHSMYADHFRNWIGGKEDTRDALGWPASDFRALLNANRSGYGGRHLLSFRGQGDVSIGGATFYVDGKPIKDRLPKGTGYDPETNITRVEFDFTDPKTGNSPRFVEIRNTQRTPDSPVGSGLTDVHVMKPIRKGADKHHGVGEMANGEWKEVILPYISFRLQSTGLCNDTRTWADRHLPGSPFYTKGAQGWPEQKEGRPADWKGNQLHVYEYVIQMANEMGRDLHFNFPSGTDYEWMDKFARLVKYGSDGEEPYDGPVKDPKYPPLNSNLRIILEHGNEMPWSSIQPRIWTRELLPNHYKAKDEVWQALNFDGLHDDNWGGASFRFHAYRTARMARAMREVYGAENMGEVVRVMIFGQYQQPHQNTFCQYIDDYFNNGAGDFVKDPTPVSELLWGAGLAVYYGGENYWAESDRVWLRDRSFEAYELEPGAAARTPSGGAWTFEGGAGVADFSDEKFPAFADAPAEETVKAPDAAIGFEFVTGDRAVHVYQLGRRNLEGGKKGVGGEMALFKADGQPVGGRPGVGFGGREFRLSKAEQEAGAWVYRNITASGWMTGDSFRPAIYRLEPNTRYILLASVTKGQKIPAPMSVQASAGITVEHAVTATTGSFESGKRALKGTIATFRAPRATRFRTSASGSHWASMLRRVLWLRRPTRAGGRTCGAATRRRGTTRLCRLLAVAARRSLPARAG